ncbi:MAG: peptidylprolyl isomerase [Desulfuromonadaceae bacterium]|jgi:peptidyl-prolyl cis-trans isomerase A (cyclophilin A)
MKSVFVTFVLIACSWALPALSAEYVLIQTNLGDIEVELDREKAPVTVENFLRYVQEGFYEGTIFHRVIRDFMIQGGGFSADLERKTTHEPIVNEAGNGLKNVRGSIAMARTSDVNSATSQFFINLKNNTFLNHSGPAASTFGYAVFGRVVDGMEVVDAIGVKKTRKMGGGFQDMPVKQIIINKVVYSKTDS